MEIFKGMTKQTPEAAFNIFYSKIKERRILWSERKNGSKEAFLIWEALAEEEYAARQTLNEIKNETSS